METFYKLVYDTGCYFAFISFFLSYTGKYDISPLSVFVFWVACFLATYADRLKRGDQVVRIGALLLPVIPFLLESNIWGKIILILPWVYLVATVFYQGYYMTYRRFRKMYLASFWIYAFIVIFFTAEDFVMGEKALLVGGPFFVIILVAGSFLLQLLRMNSGTKDKQKLEKHQRRQLILFLMIAVLFTAGNVMEFLYRYIIFPISEVMFGTVLSAGVFVIMQLTAMVQDRDVSKFKQSDWKEFIEAAAEEGGGLEAINDAFGQIRDIYSAGGPAEPIELDVTLLALAAIVLVAIVILIILFGGQKGKHKQAAIEEETEAYFDDDVKTKQVLKKNFVSPAISIRYYYREFMKKSETHKHSLKPSDTTEEILEKYNTRNIVSTEQTKEAEEATALYQKTRYSNASMTHEDAGRMKALVKKL